MKRKVFDLRPWSRAVRSSQSVVRVPGHVIVDFTAHEVAKPKDVSFGDQTIRILDHGFRWVRVHPAGSGEGRPGSALSAMLDETGLPRQLYVDLHGGEGLGEDGLPWHDDLYLDVIGNWVVGEAGHGTVTEAHIIDGEDLEEAVAAGLVSPSQAEATWAHAREIQAGLLAGTYPPLAVLRRYLEDPYT
ncbi:DUF402 domain-containing protein [Deinococcus arcticus]|uniref:DUF402 domain-containing protein n=1 Tax=Deinococcus arcticus TaxID=2136176 RepID=A0A2T3WAN1_9DEIO|nr:DUF402 domain-containing protein [Deinococcus arcticus]PTA68960.1 hypothetical protein C8263_03930 [Deinococcus arcticus]